MAYASSSRELQALGKVDRRCLQRQYSFRSGREEKRRIEPGGFAQQPGEGDDVIRHFESRDFFGAITWS